MNAVVLGLGSTLEARVLSLPSQLESLSGSFLTEPNLQGRHAAFSSPSSPRSIETSPSSPRILSWCLRSRLRQGCYTSYSWSLILYFFLKSAANAVLKLISAVFAIAHVQFVSIKLLSVSVMLLEYSFGELKPDSTTLPMSGFLGPSSVSASRSTVSLAIFNFFI